MVSSIPQAGDKAVNPGLTKISVTFSKPMAQSLVNGRTATLDVQLEPDTTYVLGTNNEQFQNFVDQDGNPAVPWVLSFHTAPE